MSITINYTPPHNTSPRDVTSPGPDQRPGVAEPQTSGTSSRKDVPPVPSPGTGDKPQEAPHYQKLVTRRELAWMLYQGWTLVDWRTVNGYYRIERSEVNMSLEHLKNSCNRLPRLIELEAPTSIITGELKILIDRAFSLLREAQEREFRKQFDAWRGQPDQAEQPRCAVCGYSEQDARELMDHKRCQGYGKAPWSEAIGETGSSLDAAR